MPFTMRWPVLAVGPTPTPILISHLGEVIQVNDNEDLLLLVMQCVERSENGVASQLVELRIVEHMNPRSM